MTNLETINQVAEVIVSALIDRLSHSEELANRLAPLVSRTISLEGVEKLTDGVEKMIDDKVREALSEVEADNVTGLDEFVDRRIESSIENLTIESENVSGLDDAIESAIGDHEVDADDVRNLEDMIDARIDEKLGDQDIDADVITGLDRAVTDTIDDVLADKVVALISDNDKVQKNICAIVENGMDVTTVLCVK